MSHSKDIQVLRQLAEKVVDISRKPIQDERRALWRKNNALEKTRPLVFVHCGNWDALGSEFINPQLECVDPLFREVEFKLRYSIIKDEIDDDEIIEPWISIPPVFSVKGWGVEPHNIESELADGAYKMVPCLKEPDDIRLLKVPTHKIDEAKTKERQERVIETVGDLIEVDRRRGCDYFFWRADISTDLAQLVGLEELMVFMHDRPEWLHQIAAFMRDGVMKAQQEAEDAGDWRLSNNSNQSMSYCADLPDPVANSGPVGRDKLWGFFASQEFAFISPAMHEEFLLNYQMPIMAKFGKVAYGCCEDLTNKINMLRKIPNLRRIAVSPWANVGRCAEQIRKDYVMAWRPSPSDTICTDWDPSRIRRIVKDAMEAAKGCIIDITLKDVQTVRHETWRFKEWTKVVRDASAGY